MIVWSAVCVYTDSKGLPQLCFNEVFIKREQAVKCILDSFYREYEDSVGNYIEGTPCEKDAKKTLVDWGFLKFDDGEARKFRWFLRSNMI